MKATTEDWGDSNPDPIGDFLLGCKMIRENEYHPLGSEKNPVMISRKRFNRFLDLGVIDGVTDHIQLVTSPQLCLPRPEDHVLPIVVKLPSWNRAELSSYWRTESGRFDGEGVEFVPCPCAHWPNSVLEYKLTLRGMKPLDPPPPT